MAEAAYRIIAAALRQDILSGRCDHAPFPSEQELRARFAVTRTTVRRALDLLVQDGLIRKQQGRRISLCFTPQKRRSWNFTSLTETLRAQHEVPCSRVDLAQLESVNGRRVFHLVRTRGFQRAGAVQYLTHEDSMLPCERFAQIERFDFAQHSLYAVMREHYQIFPCRGESVLSAVLPSPELCAAFKIEALQPLICARQTIFDAEDRVIEEVTISYSPYFEISIARAAGH